ncbi:MAG: aspartate kinase [Chryseolinea sp.]
MRVFKFGGASLRNADGVKNVASIIRQQPQQELLVVVSAMGKTTDMLERIHELGLAKKDFASTFSTLKNYHAEVVNTLFTKASTVSIEIDRIFETIESEIGKAGDADQVYDQIVSQGEILSSIIIHHYLAAQGVVSRWIDARDYIATDNTFREGKINWSLTGENIAQLADALSGTIVVTQGFIGRTSSGLTTTLGREGSDFTAAIFASCLSAESLTIWKDVAGVMNADPRRHPDTIIFDELPFREAAEMTYYGASVIHPKTIKPLANKGIPLLVKNFQDPSLPGTIIHECQVDNLPPLIVVPLSYVFPLVLLSVRLPVLAESRTSATLSVVPGSKALEVLPMNPA